MIPKGTTETTQRNAYLVTFNENNQNPIDVLSNNKIPLTKKEIDITNIVTLDPTDNTIQFNVPGYYQINFTAFAYASDNGRDFDQTKDFVSIGLRTAGTDDIYVGASKWTNSTIATEITGQGIISVPYISTPFELVNLSPSTIHLTSPDMNYIKSSSYFTNPLVTITIEYLGRQNI